MSDKDLAESIQAMKNLRSELLSDPAKAHAFLVRVGIATPQGQLTKQYQ